MKKALRSKKLALRLDRTAGKRYVSRDFRTPKVFTAMKPHRISGVACKTHGDPEELARNS